MKRSYSEGVADDIDFFVGVEVEHTPALGRKTLFITGVHSVSKIKEKFIEHQCTHIFFGANHSFAPVSADEWIAWEDMISPFLKDEILCSLDIPVNLVNEFNETVFNEYDNFIPQIRVPIPYVRLWNYNTTIKFDDVGFRQTNPGVWSVSLHSVLDRKHFTDWQQYNNDQII